MVTRDSKGRFIKAQEAWYETETPLSQYRLQDEFEGITVTPEPSYKAIHAKYYLIWGISTGIGMFVMLLLGKFYSRYL